MAAQREGCRLCLFPPHHPRYPPDKRNNSETMQGQEHRCWAICVSMKHVPLLQLRNGSEIVKRNDSAANNPPTCQRVTQEIFICSHCTRHISYKSPRHFPISRYGIWWFWLLYDESRRLELEMSDSIALGEIEAVSLTTFLSVYKLTQDDTLRPSMLSLCLFDLLNPHYVQSKI